MREQSKKDYREEVEYHTGYDSAPSSEDDDASSSSSNSPSSSSSSSNASNSEEERRQRRHAKRKTSKVKREKRSKRANSSEDEEEEEEQQRRKRARHTVEEHPDEWRHRGSSGSRRKKHHHHHHHRKHKHKHRRHRRHHSEERGGRGGDGRSLERPVDGRKGREVEERRARERLEPERERRSTREEKKERKEEKRSREKGRNEASRPVKSKWDDEEDSVSSDISRRIKVEPGLEREGSEGWDGEYEESNGRGRRQKHQQQRRRPHPEEGVRPVQRVKEEPESRSSWDNSNSTANSENGRTSWGAGGNGGGDDGNGNAEGEEQEREKPNLAVTGKLAEDTNMYNGVVIKYSQPSEARKPKRRWRWYIFKGDEELPFLPLHRQSAYLIGRDRKVADIPTDHPSCSKQHAVLQYRLVSYNREDGTKGRTVKPYILDLGSANGTFVNNRRIDSKKFVELLEKDVVKFGYSSREYILLHEGSKGDDEDMPDTGADLSPVSLLRS
ncbi:FHA domain-containing protein DDL-like isoform X3 [Portunus trituberculatus]|uniref:FHA domain-containing protein DDL-like isoform X3 n=1 Tax=Portunus trituberculatus TaxID=210409 RepID=UPI001E1CBD7D|nr:FHA domain-containing protein DDL-like isoform X3 [Portunus trituberculatus]